jgi:RHS repeat-associated protein
LTSRSSYADPVGGSTGHAAWVYNQSGQLVSDTTQGTRATSYAYSATLLRLTGMTDAIGTRNIRYGATTGTPDSVSDPTDSWVRYAFDGKGRLHGPYLTASTGYAFSRTQFYRANGGLFELSNDQHYTVGELWQTPAEVADTLVQLWTEQRGLSGPQVTMRDSVTYDGWERVTALVHLTDGQVTASDTFAFDERGNLTRSGNGATFNTEDQLTSTSACASWTYDAAGNLTGKQCAGKWWVYTYDVLDRLTGVTFHGAFVAAYTYDVLGNRIAKRTATDTTRFVWRGGHVIYETSAGGTIRYSYQWGLGTDDLLAIHDHGSGAHYYVVQDKLHSVRGLVNQNGNWKAAWRYRGYGVVLDSAVSGSVAGLHRFGWAGAQYDPETGLYFLRTRYYDPQVGRFVQEDKIGRAGGTNLYAYAVGRPTAARDPGGTYASDDAIYFHFHWERLQVSYQCVSWCDTWNGWDILTYAEQDSWHAVYALLAKGYIDAAGLKGKVRVMELWEFNAVMTSLNLSETFVNGVGLVAMARSFVESGRFVVDAGLDVTSSSTLGVTDAFGTMRIRLTVLHASVFSVEAALRANVVIHESLHLAGFRSRDGQTSFTNWDPDIRGPAHCEVYMYANAASGYWARTSPASCNEIFAHYGYRR